MLKIGNFRAPISNLPKVLTLAEQNYDRIAGVPGAGRRITSASTGGLQKMIAIVNATGRLLAGDRSDAFRMATVDEDEACDACHGEGNVKCKACGGTGKRGGADRPETVPSGPPGTVPSGPDGRRRPAAGRNLELDVYNDLISSGRSREAGQYYQNHGDAIVGQQGARRAQAARPDGAPGTRPGDPEGAPEDELEDCPGCNGSGRVNGKKCARCGGRGKIPAVVPEPQQPEDRRRAGRLELDVYLELQGNPGMSQQAGEYYQQHAEKIVAQQGARRRAEGPGGHGA